MVIRVRIGYRIIVSPSSSLWLVAGERIVGVEVGKVWISCEWLLWLRLLEVHMGSCWWEDLVVGVLVRVEVWHASHLVHVRMGNKRTDWICLWLIILPKSWILILRRSYVLRNAHDRWSLLHWRRHWRLRETISRRIKITAHWIVRRISHKRHRVGCYHPCEIVAHHLLLRLRLEETIIHGLLRTSLVKHLSSLHILHHLLGKDILLLLIHILDLITFPLHVLLVIITALSLSVRVQSIVFARHENAVIIEECWLLSGFAHAQSDDEGVERNDEEDD